MTVEDLKERAAARLEISELNTMQAAMAEQTLPCRALLVAPTGAGKTLAFAIPFLSSLPQASGEPVGLVIAPTRELVLQIFEVVRTLASPDYKVCALYGGHNMQAEMASVAGNPDIIIATPGRLLDHLHRGALSLYTVRSVVLDEYDKALELGFQKEMKSLMGRLRKTETLILTSATQAPELPDFIDAASLKTLNLSAAEAASPDLTIYRVDSPDADKLGTLEQLLRSRGGRTLVFVNHREAAERVASAMQRAGLPAGLYHGALEQDLRERALILFGNGTTPILIATDLAARGLDIPEVETVVHYHLPVSPEVWTHRNGRTGRQGGKGDVVVITSEKDKVPPFVVFSDQKLAENTADDVNRSKIITLYINAGRRDKISRADVAGFILRNTDLRPEQLGRIDLRDHSAYAAVPAERTRELVEALKPHKLKGQRVRVSQIKG